MAQEARRAVREGFDEESLAVYDLLRKPGLEPREVARIKAVVREQFEALKAEKRRVDCRRDKQATRDTLRMAIHDLLYDERMGLPPAWCTTRTWRRLPKKCSGTPSFGIWMA
ncbi:type I site-specific deoxyribonuclease, HsdR family protein [Nitrococcus mobilis Nb-231]|uniref:Type I site-specific deoxyribonuclease, HsdR family protein n=1 Tax=Nitrococcus mobilis Nb-231 TaxID=314278 RepID=A4BPU0_9GAMM|nr:type I site-specific deoxyribonuclease, HsdR family protein [Nitrococcus mobilis Nb-231]